MPIYLDLSYRHKVIAANAHYYKEPTAERYIDRILPCHDLIYIQEGSWSMVEETKVYPLAKGDVLLLSAGRHHYTKLPCQPETKTFCLHITNEHGDTPDSGEKKLCLPTWLHVQHSPRVKSFFEEIVTTFWQDSSFKQEEMSALLDLLFLEIKKEFDQQKNKCVDIAQVAIDMVTSNPHHRYSAKEIADCLYVSTRTLDNAMNKKVGMPFYSYQKNCKLDMIASILAMEPEVHLREIARAYGFHDEFHMSKSFKQRFDMAPTAYRNMKLEKHKP